MAQAGRDAVLGMAAILVPADVPRLLAALDELVCFPDEDVRQSVVIMLAGLTGLLAQRSCTELLLPRVMRLLEDNAYLVRKVGSGAPGDASFAADSGLGYLRSVVSCCEEWLCAGRSLRLRWRKWLPV